MDISKAERGSILVHRVAIVAPWVQFLTEVGTPVESAFRQARLPWGALEDVDNYVPSPGFWAFVSNTAESQAIPDLGFRVAEKFGAESLDPFMTALLQRSPTAYHGLKGAARRINQTITHCQVGFMRPPRGDYAYLYHHPSCGHDHPATEQIGWFGIMSLIGMARVFTGPDWLPDEIGVMTDNVPGRYIAAHFPNTRIRRRQPASYITLRNTELSLPAARDAAGSNAFPQAAVTGSYRHAPDDFARAVQTLLRAYVEERDLSIELIAGLCDVSTRSLQRRLNAGGTTYNELLGNARFHASKHWLADHSVPVTEVAYRLGYSDAAHFARAFKRIAGITPTAYRQQFTH